MHKVTITNALWGDLYDVHVAGKGSLFPVACCVSLWQEKVGLSWMWGWAGTRPIPWLVSCLGCHRGCRKKTRLTCLITSQPSRRSQQRGLFSSALSSSVYSSSLDSQNTMSIWAWVFLCSPDMRVRVSSVCRQSDHWHISLFLWSGESFNPWKNCEVSSFSEPVQGVEKMEIKCSNSLGCLWTVLIRDSCQPALWDTAPEGQSCHYHRRESKWEIYEWGIFNHI